MSRIKLVVINENTFGYISPEQMPVGYVGIFRASIIKRSRFCEMIGPMPLHDTDVVRLATKKDFDEFRISFADAYETDEYEYQK